MLLYHEVEGTAKPVPPGVKHIVTSSNLPAAKCAKLKESTAHMCVTSAASTEVQLLSCSRQEQDTREKAGLKCLKCQKLYTMATAMPPTVLGKREERACGRRGATHNHSQASAPPVPRPCLTGEAPARGRRGCTAYRCWLRVTT